MPGYSQAAYLACLSALVTALIVLLVCYTCLHFHWRLVRTSGFLPACYEGLTSGMMPSIDEPPPTPCGAAGIGARGRANCCSGHNVPPVVS